MGAGNGIFWVEKAAGFEFSGVVVVERVVVETMGDDCNHYVVVDWVFLAVVGDCGAGLGQ
jgi:hypothetical protein